MVLIVYKYCTDHEKCNSLWNAYVWSINELGASVENDHNQQISSEQSKIFWVLWLVFITLMPR